MTTPLPPDKTNSPQVRSPVHSEDPISPARTPLVPLPVNTQKRPRSPPTTGSGYSDDGSSGDDEVGRWTPHGPLRTTLRLTGW